MADYDTGSATVNGTRVVYRLFSPRGMVAGTRYPLVLTLHGVGESGNNNTAQLNNGMINWANEQNQARNKSFVLSPQCPGSMWWTDSGWSTGVYRMTQNPAKSLAAVIHALDSLVAVLPVDTNRLYIAGLSMGGMGTWDMIMRFPSRFAAAVPVCGAVDTTRAPLLTALPVWTWHGSADGTVPPLGTRTIMRRLAALGETVIYPMCGANTTQCTPLTQPQLLAALPTAEKLFTELPGVGHNAWDYAFVDTMLFRWVFMQAKNRGSTAVAAGQAARRPTIAPALYGRTAVSLTGRKVRAVAAKAAIIPAGGSVRVDDGLREDR